MAMNWSDTPYEDAVREQATSQTDYRALSAQLAQALSVISTDFCDSRTNEMLLMQISRDIGQVESALDAARKAGIL